MRWEDPTPWKWFTRCAECWREHFSSDIDCPRCGAPSRSPEGPVGEECLVCGTHVGPNFVDDLAAPVDWTCECELPSVYHRVVYDNGTMLEATKPEYNISYSLNYGVTGYDWDEKHRCPKCRHVYWIRNSSC